MTDNNDPSIEDPSDADDLLYSTSYGTREFHSGPKGKDIIIGVILEENEDSFLVAMPVHILNKEQTSTFILEQLSYNEPFTRLIKNSVSYVSYPEVDHDMAYIDFLQKEAKDIFPELLEMIGAEDEEIRQEKEDDDELILNPEPVQISGPSGEVLINGNFSSEELKEKVESAIRNGNLLTSSGKLAN